MWNYILPVVTVLLAELYGYWINSTLPYAMPELSLKLVVNNQTDIATYRVAIAVADRQTDS